MEEDENVLNFLKHFLGLRKIKSIIALAVCFGVWQLIRIIFPELEPHPIYAYFYAIIEMRNNIDTQKQTSFSRIKANTIGYVIAFGAIALNTLISKLPINGDYDYLFQFLIIILSVLVALNLAELFNCTPLCAIAATTFIICFCHTETSPYFYATIRFIQTLMSVGIAYVINLLIFKPENS